MAKTMTLAEIFKAKGIGEDIIQGILDDMKANKIFTASEENLDVRYGKLKTDHEGVTKQLGEANTLIEELKKSTKGQEDLQGKITAYEAQVEQLQAELEKTKLDSAIKVELLSSRALDVDYLTFKLKEKGELALDEDGKIKGWEDKLAALKTQFPTQFEDVNGGDGGYHVLDPNKLEKGNPNEHTPSKEEFRTMTYEQRVALKQKNEELYKKLKQ
jgi:hypothetical protein